jgi:hypothetical protein
MPGFLDVIHQIVNGTPVDAATTNVPLSDLQNNVLYLKNLLLATTGSQALYVRNATLNPALLPGQPVYYNSAAGYYDLALADGSVKENVTGLVASKASPNVGDIVTLGYAQLSLANAVPGNPTPDTAGRYFLSTTQAGKLTLTQPAPSVIVCMADGVGGLIVAPSVRDARGVQGYQGKRGYQGERGNQGPLGTGPRGPQGILSAQPTLLSASGTTTASFAAALTVTGANGLVGMVTLKNTDSNNNLQWQVTVTDAFGTGPRVSNGALSIGTAQTWDMAMVLASPAAPPYVSFTLSVQDSSAGNHAAYSIKGSVLK